MSRKPIEENVKRRLFVESMGRCMNPNCRKELFESCGDIIEKAHIDPYSDTEDNLKIWYFYVQIVILILIRIMLTRQMK